MILLDTDHTTFLKYPDSSSQALRPVLSEVALKREATLRVATLDVAASPATTERWGVTEIPTMVLLNRGIVERVLLGVRPATRLLQEIDEAL